ncbi:hypothetical protein CJ030_MR0G004428 [Morella rubra]|uniref:non-specific serine/threonine protein kinase n=1 Tax=Morella rubra TaxID=262757 RepID=A0A6A1UN37_9ROSI|nr:hypothetical protein CJ030_MR0G004428 [Morella rubra]
MTSSTGIDYTRSNQTLGPASYWIVYEGDNETLGPATYYMSNTNRWAVSTVGYFTGVANPQWQSTSIVPDQLGNLDSQIFRTARISASSLRYYGLGLLNGNYTLTLQFFETAIVAPSWRNLGRRVFDVYIQGNRVLENFNIRKEAGGSALQAVEKVYSAQVSENYLEIHLFWAGKGTFCIPRQGAYGPSISAISATADFTLPVPNKPSNGKNRADLIVELLGINARPFSFSYTELKTATEDFNPAIKLGEGGFGPVYKGTLKDGRVIAVKQLSETSHQGKNQFIAEIATISAVQHRNLVKLYGCCSEGDKRLLVYEFLENGSLDRALFGKRSLNLNWSMRYHICLGIARGLAYLHEESRQRIVHRDVKASNILLDSGLIPKISDFGLAKLYDDKMTHISTRVAGTIGYLAPEYAMRGHLTEKADVFAFGVVGLEIVHDSHNHPKLCVYASAKSQMPNAWHLYENHCEDDLLDSTLSESNEDEVKRVIGVSLLCTQASPLLRPSMSRVVAMLSGDMELSTLTSRPGYLIVGAFDDVISLTSGVAARGMDGSYHNSSGVASEAENTPVDPSIPMLFESIKGG